MIAGFCNNSNDQSAQDTVDFSYIIDGAPHSDNEIEYAPTIEYRKMINGRANFHSNSCYYIGPYDTTKGYFLGCYDREIFHYTHTDQVKTCNGACERNYARKLAKQRKALSSEDFVDGPFVLVHGGFHGRNIMVKDGYISGILDWEFAGSYPLS